MAGRRTGVRIEWALNERIIRSGSVMERRIKECLTSDCWVNVAWIIVAVAIIAQRCAIKEVRQRVTTVAEVDIRSTYQMRDGNRRSVGRRHGNAFV